MHSNSTIIVSANSFWNIANFRIGLIRGLREAGYRPIIAAPDPDSGWTLGHQVESVHLPIDRSGLNPFRDVGLILAYWRLFQRRKPAFFVSFTAKPNIYGAFAARMAGVPAIPNISGLGTAFMSDGLLSRFVSRLYRVALAETPIVFFQNPDDRDLFVARGIVRKEKTRLLPGSGIDVDRFSPGKRGGSDVPSFLFIGRLLGDKGVREFAAAARLLKDNCPGWRFRLLGPIDADNRSAISREELDRWVGEGIVEYLGSQDDVRPFIDQATAVVLPSYREGLPRSLLEGAAMAKPLIATDVPGNRHIVEHGVNGLLCEVRNAHSLADAMRQIGELGTGDRAALGAAGRARVEREFSERQVVDAYLDALRELTPTVRSGSGR